MDFENAPISRRPRGPQLSSRPSGQLRHRRGRTPLITTNVASPESSALRALHPAVQRVKVARSPESGATKVLADWSDTVAMRPSHWGATIGQISCLLAGNMSLDATITFPVVPQTGLHLDAADHEHSEPGMEILFDPRAMAHLEVVVDRITPDADTLLWMFSALRAAAAGATLLKEATI